MSRIVLILGGARSGKSTYAVQLAAGHKKVAFIATSQALDGEMRKRISAHQKARPAHWKTFEETQDLVPLLKKAAQAFDCIIVDCLTLWVSNLVLAENRAEEILKKTEAMLAGVKKKKAKVILVSNEVGLGVVPQTKLGRDFRDIAGKVNQKVAQKADEVFFTVSGLPMKIKGEEP